MSKIKSIKARKILDSRANWTVEVDLITDRGLFRSSVPSGASKGKYEAPTLSPEKAVKNINQIIAPKLKGKNPTKQKEIDSFLSPKKFGANATTGVSLAVCRAGAVAQNLPLYKYIAKKLSEERPSYNLLPRAAFNVINGGVHAGNELDFQEFMIVPQKNSFSENLKIGTEIYHKIKKNLAKKYGKLATNLGDEGGFAPPLRVPEEALNLILAAAKNLKYQNKIKIILDIASSQFYKKGKYKMKIGLFTRKKLLNFYSNLIKKYPIIGIEDPFAEDDFESWQKFKPKNFLAIGDDLLVTNPERIKIAKEKDLCNGLLLKINQIGTITKALEAAKLAKSYGWKIMVSHRSGETTDDFIADFAVGISADFIKSGAPARGERVVKYNRLLKIEEEIRSAI